MALNRKPLVPERILEARLEWLNSARRKGGNGLFYPNYVPDLKMLTSGFDASISPHWSIGIAAAMIEEDSKTKQPFIAVSYQKPPERRTSDEHETSVRYYDPAAFLVQQLHVIFGGSLALKGSRSHQRIPYHYPVVNIYRKHGKLLAFRFIRGIVDAASDRLTSSGGDFKDLRRSALQKALMTQSEATEMFGAQKGGRYVTRLGAIEASLDGWIPENRILGRSMSRREYEIYLRQSYELLDKHELFIRDLASHEGD